MYLDCKVRIPETQGKITVKTIRQVSAVSAPPPQPEMERV